VPRVICLHPTGSPPTEERCPEREGKRLTHTLYVLAAFLIGAGSATQTAMLGSIGKDRGPFEAAWISFIGTAVGLSLLLAARGVRDDVDLPAPLSRVEFWLAAAALTALLLALSIRGTDPGYGVVGLFGLALIVGAAILIPRIGVAQFAIGLTAGVLIASLTLDHTGAFGNEVRAVSAVRVAGAGLALVGAFLVRFEG
jgi:uncharacterized membrane protein YdcZ (DUF606 family)